jgi:hypothetical protein
MLGLIVLSIVIVVTAIFAVVGILVNKSANHNENPEGRS